MSNSSSNEAGKDQAGKRRRQKQGQEPGSGQVTSPADKNPANLAQPPSQEQEQEQPPPRTKRQLTPTELEGRRRGGRTRGEQLKTDKAHQSRAARASHQSQGKEKLAEQGRKNLAKALEHYPDLYERAGDAALKGMAAKKERERLERERLAQAQEQTRPEQDKPSAQSDQARPAQEDKHEHKQKGENTQHDDKH